MAKTASEDIRLCEESGIIMVLKELDGFLEARANQLHQTFI